MSSKRFRQRSHMNKHTPLSTQQRRLRHLTCVIGRNINSRLVPAKRQSSRLLSLYYTLHTSNDHEQILYKSEIIDNTLNPNWREFDLDTFLKDSDHKRASSVFLCVWGSRGKNMQFTRMFCSHVEFSSLQYNREKLRTHDRIYESNCILFRLFDGYYFIPKENLDVEVSPTVKVPNDQIVLSYRQSSLLRCHFSLKAIHETKFQVNDVEEKMLHMIASSKHKQNMKHEKECLLFRTKLLHEKLKAMKEKHQQERNYADEQKTFLENKENELEGCFEDLKYHKEEMKSAYQTHVETRKEQLKVSAQLAARRRQLAADLTHIYNIQQLPLTTKGENNNKREYSITGVKLPETEAFSGHNDTMLAVGVGYVAHLVLMMCKLMDVPLRYPLTLMGSRSSVHDHVTEKIPEREFPLYPKSKEMYQFHYGVFLLNKNIAQLRYLHELRTSDLRPTLQNLKHLFETKYQVHFNQNTTPLPHHYLPRNNAISTSHKHLSMPQLNDLRDVDQNDAMRHNDVTTLRNNGANHLTPSGLPNVHVKQSEKQHKFIKSRVKLHKSLSLPEGLESTSPNLLQTPFEDILRASNASVSHHMTSSPRDSMSTICETKVFDGIDRGEECLEEGRIQEGVSSSRVYLSRQLSDALIIPDPFEEHNTTDCDVLV